MRSVKIHELRPVGAGPGTAVYESDTVGLNWVVTFDDYFALMELVLMHDLKCPVGGVGYSDGQD